MKPRLSVAVLFMVVTFGTMAKDMVHVKQQEVHRSGFSNHSCIADTAEKPDEHVREDQHLIIRATR